MSAEPQCFQPVSEPQPVYPAASRASSPGRPRSRPTRVPTLATSISRPPCLSSAVFTLGTDTSLPPARNDLKISQGLPLLLSPKDLDSAQDVSLVPPYFLFPPNHSPAEVVGAEGSRGLALRVSPEPRFPPRPSTARCPQRPLLPARAHRGPESDAASKTPSLCAQGCPPGSAPTSKAALDCVLPGIPAPNASAGTDPK